MVKDPRPKKVDREVWVKAAVTEHGPSAAPGSPDQDWVSFYYPDGSLWWGSKPADGLVLMDDVSDEAYLRKVALMAQDLVRLVKLSNSKALEQDPIMRVFAEVVEDRSPYPIPSDDAVTTGVYTFMLEEARKGNEDAAIMARQMEENGMVGNG